MITKRIAVTPASVDAQQWRGKSTIDRQTLLTAQNLVIGSAAQRRWSIGEALALSVTSLAVFTLVYGTFGVLWPAYRDCAVIRNSIGLHADQTMTTCTLQTAMSHVPTLSFHLLGE